MKYVIIFVAIAVYAVLWAVTAYYLTIDEKDDANRAACIMLSLAWPVIWMLVAFWLIQDQIRERRKRK